MRMPEVLANATEAVISKWLIAEGESFNDGQPIAEVETDKALVEVPAEGDGILGKYIVGNGAHVQVGAPIAVLIAAGEGRAEIDKAIAESGAQVAAPVAAASAPDETPTATPAAAAPALIPVAPAVPNPALHGSRIFASPLARRLAKENGLDTALIAGTGPGGRIVRGDVQEAIARGGARAASPSPTTATPAAGAIPMGSFTEIPHSGMRKAIARRLTESKSNVPHFYLSAPVLSDEMLTCRNKINTWAPRKISVTDLILKTVEAAFQDVPGANCIWTDTAIRQFSDVDVSIAVATDKGLVTPVVRGINHMSLSQLSAATADLIDRARIGRLKQNEIEGGTFSVTNLGMYGTDAFSAILNPPQSAILAVGAARQKPVVVDGEIKVASVINFTLSVDHRAIDGSLAAEWLAAFVKRFENPFWLWI
jgi:pyruvate dehydrogenase E2 component (dihydrolipoamide acetyltransferase)